MKEDLNHHLQLPVTRQNIYEVPNPHQLNKKQIEQLSADERELLAEEFARRLLLLKGAARDLYQKQTEQLMPTESAGELWETNHAVITQAIATLMRVNGNIPTKAEICAETGLSRSTVYRHLKEYGTTPHYQNQVGQLKFLSSNMLAQLYKRAAEGDLAAARMYFTFIKSTDNHKTNYLKTPELVIEQADFDRLPAESVAIIERLVVENRKDK